MPGMSGIELLKSVRKQNSDVIFILQAGFIGMWGEWHGDTHIAHQELENNVVYGVGYSHG